jgi:hypothetical protein
MSTANEIMLRANAAHARVGNLAARLEREVMRPLSVCLIGREVGAKRARKLRRAGHTVQFFKNTHTGKVRYEWVPKSRISLATPPGDA